MCDELGTPTVDPDTEGVAERGDGEVDEATKETDMLIETLRWWL
jgi:hypothetical protein